MSSRAFQLESAEGLRRVFFPWIDMANHADEPNSELTQSAGAIHLHTLRAVAKGEEVISGCVAGRNANPCSFVHGAVLSVTILSATIAVRDVSPPAHPPTVSPAGFVGNLDVPRGSEPDGQHSHVLRLPPGR